MRGERALAGRLVQNVIAEHGSSQVNHAQGQHQEKRENERQLHEGSPAAIVYVLFPHVMHLAEVGPVQICPCMTTVLVRVIVLLGLLELYQPKNVHLMNG